MTSGQANRDAPTPALGPVYGATWLQYVASPEYQLMSSNIKKMYGKYNNNQLESDKKDIANV